MLEKFNGLFQEKNKKIISFLMFSIITTHVFISTTYLFRNVMYDRTHIVGIENEAVNLDMVYVGGSAAFVYWQPLKAWNDYGFTSYNYATNTIQAESIKYYLKEIQQTQNPSLYVIGIRAFQYWSETGVEEGLRVSTDSMDFFSKNRWELISKYLSTRDMADDTDYISYYFDIAKYHTNLEGLKYPESWSFIDNDNISINKGWEWVDAYAYLEDNPPSTFQTEERADLGEGAEEILIDLLEYCNSEDLNVLFVVCPYYITESDYAKYNTMSDIISSYGYKCLNTNDYYEEMGIDFSHDFYNKNHVNAYGAEKYTAFLEEYIVYNYDMPNHKGEENYSSWDKDYERFSEEERLFKEQINYKRLDVEQGLIISEQMRNTTNLAEWYTLVEDQRYSMIVVQKGDLSPSVNYADIRILFDLGFTSETKDRINVIDYSDGTKNRSNIDGVSSIEGALGPWLDIPYKASIDGDSISIKVAKQEYALNRDGINIVVFDNNYRQVVDSVVLQNNEGKIVIAR